MEGREQSSTTALLKSVEDWVFDQPQCAPLNIIEVSGHKTEAKHLQQAMHTGAQEHNQNEQEYYLQRYKARSISPSSPIPTSQSSSTWELKGNSTLITFLL